MKKITDIRKAFWDNHPEFKSEYRKTYKQNDYNATIRTSFVDYVESLQRNSIITESLARRVTL